MAHLKDSNRVIACDIRGFGKSKDENSALSIDLFAEDLIQFMDKLAINKAVICGLSMGGFIALNAQIKYPDRFDAIILCDTQCMSDSFETKQMRYETIETIQQNGAAEFNEGFIKSVFHPDSFRSRMEIVETLKKVVFANTDHIIMEGLKVLAERSATCATLMDIKIPTLIICGREDIVTPLAQSEYMNDEIEVSTLYIIENAGHVSNLEQSNEFNKQLADFLATLGSNKAEIINGSERMV
jgi:pimeloyl-ACP methyl ester carboxylesterase